MRKRIWELVGSRKAQLTRNFGLVLLGLLAIFVVAVVNPLLSGMHLESEDYLHSNMGVASNRMHLSTILKMPVYPVGRVEYFKTQMTYAEAIDLIAHDIGSPSENTKSVFCNMLTHDILMYSPKLFMTIEFSNDDAAKNFECGTRKGNKRHIYLKGQTEEWKAMQMVDAVTFTYPSVMEGETIKITQEMIRQ